MFSATLPSLLLPHHSGASKLHGAGFARIRTLLLAQDATRSAGEGPLPRHDLFGLSPREWAHQVPRDVSKDEYVACAERVHEAARTDGFKALAEELAKRERNPAQEAVVAAEWVVALKLLAALFPVRRLVLSSWIQLAAPSLIRASARRSPGGPCVAALPFLPPATARRPILPPLQFSEVVSNPHAVRSRHSDPLMRRPSV